MKKKEAQNESENKSGKKAGKEPDRKPKYGTAVCIKWLFVRMWQWDKSIVWMPVLMVPVSVVLYAFGLYLPSAVLDKLQTAGQFSEVAVMIVALLLAQMVFQIIKEWLDSVRDMAQLRNANRFYYELVKKEAQQDFYLWYDKENNQKQERARAVLGNSAGGSPGQILVEASNVAVSVICFLLFGSVISLLSPWIVVLLVLGALVQARVRKWKQEKNHLERDERNANNMKFQYLTWRLSNRPKAGKDIRLYHLTPFLEEKGRVLVQEHIRLLKRQQNYDTVLSMTGYLTSLLRDGLAYFFLIQGVVAGEIGSAEFVLYFSAISQMSGFIEKPLNYFGRLQETGLKLSDCIEYLDEERSRFNHGEGLPLPMGRAFSVEFRNVTYKYPEGEKNILENVSFKIEAGEKISLVGLNGAGKTTMVKLMCGLMLPNEGEVLINGHNVLEYNIDELYSHISMVPQNYTILPTTIAENIAFCQRENIDEERLWQCLERADMAEKVRALKHGLETQMEKSLDEDAVEFSGGEMQKILLARALYRNADLLILDEPTAALDPIAEDRMYHRYGDIAGNATSVFISHRLASTRFCDRIYLLEGAKLMEVGTHEELMALGGRYRELFDVQSKYYKEGGEECER